MIRQMSKVYSGKTVKALDDVSLDIFKDEIFVLLGPNGAGKSTLINILIGNVVASEGGAQLNNTDFTEWLESNRDKVGICPQYNIIFPNLTVEEHLQLFAIFKGVEPNLIADQIANVNTQLRLHTFMDKQACNLSGGQKRRLSIAVALMGSSEFVVLDEPTAGLDPTSRRELWDLLKKTK
mmetsp:Transcript_115750/g.248738  ORF Transcript_115750/g.248738 Transcript_115750/m.248738 type:complete len:180 (-) Transcript_115750:3232-3771(-)|eukprot:CAMPEP_0116903960 /NCGR_PEP_ID=MMETSP0467-20121206/11076_1 /TAXON_ID=283647 /ORGANISM="Mesodinium pulex, Strain SPMC105" /LENGTH=179 /DNA_ID=CAMNT_0004578397 /DNA_START=374 /DNA_END=913 /DNA_ORIENTATION=+